MLRTDVGCNPWQTSESRNQIDRCGKREKGSQVALRRETPPREPEYIPNKDTRSR